MTKHVVRTAGEVPLTAPTGWASGATGYTCAATVGETSDALHTGFELCRLEPGGSLPQHVHSFEESFFVTEGVGVLDTAEGSFRLRSGGYGSKRYFAAAPITVQRRGSEPGRLPPSDSGQRRGERGQKVTT